jgi:GTP-binding protein Era
MNQEAHESLRSADAALFMTDALEVENPLRRRADAAERSDAELIELLPAQLPTVLVLNKVDLVRDKTKLLPVLEALGKLREFAAIVPISAKSGDGVDRVLGEVVRLLPEQDGRFAADEITDRPVAFFAREYVREQVLTMFSREVPHAVAVTLDSIEESPQGMHVAATIHVEKLGQRAILVGKGGEKIRDIGTAARQRLSELTGQTVHLKLFVRVTERWRNVPRQLAELGYTTDR